MRKASHYLITLDTISTFKKPTTVALLHLIHGIATLQALFNRHFPANKKAHKMVIKMPDAMNAFEKYKLMNFIGRLLTKDQYPMLHCLEGL